jgi:hypothetical protein
MRRAESFSFEVREHHCDLAALGGVLRLRLGRDGGLRCCGGCACQLADGREHYPPMPEQDANVLQVLIGQMAKRSDTDSVSAKRCAYSHIPSLSSHSAISCTAAHSPTHLAMLRRRLSEPKAPGHFGRGVLRLVMAALAPPGVSLSAAISPGGRPSRRCVEILGCASRPARAAHADAIALPLRESRILFFASKRGPHQGPRQGLYGRGGDFAARSCDSGTWMHIASAGARFHLPTRVARSEQVPEQC